MKRLLQVFLSGVLILICISGFAQDRTVSGRVTSTEDGQGLPGVSVVLKGTTTGAATDAEGRYTVSVPSSDAILVFSFIGLETQEMEVGTRTSIDIQMKPDSRQLAEVVITETGYTQERKFLGSTGIVSADVMERTPMASLDQSLQGRVAGVLVNSGSGQPGSNATVRIRGVSSISGAGAQPLYVVDGVPVMGDLSGINVNDIVSTTVLKDGSGGALYGARGSYGVIVITTKRGQAGTNSLDFRTQVGYSLYPKPNNFPMMNTAQALEYERGVGAAGFSITGPGWVYSPDHPSYASQTSEEQARRDGLLADFRSNNRDYYGDLFRNGISTTNELVARGGTETSKYYASFNAFNQEGFAEGSDFKRYTGRLNVDQQLGKITFSFNSTVASSETNSSVGEWLGNSPGNPFQIVWRAKPYEQVYKDDGTLDFGAHTTTAPKYIANAIERAENSIFRQRDLRILGGISLKYEIIKGLSIRNNFGVDINSSQGMYSINPNSYVGLNQSQNSGFHTEAQLNRSQMVNTVNLSYSTILNSKHEIEGNAFFEAVKQMNNGFGYQLFNLDKRLTETGQNAGNIPTTAGQPNYPQNGSGAKSQYGIRSYFGTARYTYNDKYTVNLNARLDGTSRILNEDNKEIFTWSAGLGWDVSNEEFMKGQNIVSGLSVRATYGEVPNISSIPGGTPYGLPGGFFSVPSYLRSQMPTFTTSTVFAGSSISGIVPNSPGNPDLRLEYVRKYNVGFDMWLFNRANLIVDLYKNITYDLFVNQPMGATSGFGGTSLPVNAGQMSNKGIETTLSGDIYKRGSFSVGASWNHAINVNNIDDLGAVDEYPTGTFLIKKGLPYGSHYNLHYIGADPATGQPMYRKADGTTTFSQSDAGQVAIFGTFLPKHVGGFSLNAKYKGISVSSFFTYQFDVVRSNNVWNWVTRGIPGYSNAVNQATVLLENQWMQPGDQKFYQSPQYDRGFTSSDLMDAKFLRFRELTISYSLKKVSMFKDVRVYARAQNLKIWSPWKGLDPEDNNNISLNEYPNPRMFAFGVDFSL